MLELRILAQGKSLPVYDLSGALGRRKAATEIGDQIEALIAFVDDLGGDPDLEDDDPAEPAGDDADAAYPEWHTLQANQRGKILSIPPEDAELDGDESDGNYAEEDFAMARLVRYVGWGAGCPISDAGGCEHDGREPEL